MKTTNNRIVVDLSKVQWAVLFYVNQYGNCQYANPHNTNTVRGQFVSPTSYAMYHPEYPGETEYERAKRLEILDKWIPVLRMQLTANHTLEYTGKKALSIWKAWQSRIFKKERDEE